MARANRMTSGPVLGSVPEPVKMPPIQPWPNIHMARDPTIPAQRNGCGRRTTNGPTPMISETAAMVQAASGPTAFRWCPTELRKWS